jgi:hypothetical protein|tara:strand:- start:5766 stop:6266 length:501 start_codon:yes stop_codon:yes gene_type:complete
MKILTVENETYDLNEIPETIDDLRYGILDYTNPANVDYYFIPLVFLESFYAPAAILQIGNTTISMPLDWHMVICDAEVGDPEVMSLMSLNDRGFTAFAFNPITGFSAQYIDVSIVNIYSDVKWYAPKLKYGHLLCVPLSDEPNSPCVLFVKDANKLPEVLDIEQLW